MIQLIRGFKDILPAESALWQHIESCARGLFEDFGFSEIRPPVMERTELFARSIGEDTDIVEKEMYTFSDRKGEMITLRPEATAAIVRAYIQHKLYAQDPVQKLYTIGPMFRRERPQKGRYRQFYQLDVEVFGVASALVDAQLILMLVTLCRRLGVTDVTPHINSLGCPECRPGFKAALSAYLEGVSDDLCVDCRRRRHTNPLRVLDCKVPACRERVDGAPSVADHLDPGCAEQFALLKEALDGLGVPYVVDPNLVRGLDYYTRATFEIQTGALGAQSAVAGGGRYDGLVEALGGPPTPATGFAVGFDRLAELAAMNRAQAPAGPDVFVASLGARSRALAFGWVTELALAGIRAEMAFDDKSLKSQMKRADRMGAARVVMVGENELDRGEVLLRDMRTRDQAVVSVDTLLERLKAEVKPSEKKES